MRIPATVQAGDRLVLFMTVNSLTGTLGSPAGWTLLQGKDGTATRGRAWTKQATATDANALVTVTSTTAIKDTMSVAAYRSTGGNSVGHCLRPDRRDDLVDHAHVTVGGRCRRRAPGWSTRGASSPPPP